MQVAERIYDRLEPEERFRPTLEAFGRHDLKEIDRLDDTCSTEIARVQSPAYFGRLRGFHKIAMMHGIFARDVMVGIWVCLSKLRGSVADCGRSQRVPTKPNRLPLRTLTTIRRLHRRSRRG